MTLPETLPPTPTLSAPSLSAAVKRFHQTVLQNPFLPHKPHPKQALFLLHEDREVLYGGAGGGGKTDALLMAALQDVHVPGYAALLLMPSYADLSLPKAGMSRAREWLAGTAARPADGGKVWHFPSGASLTFGYLSDKGDEQRYRTAEFQFIGFDELTRFPELPYRYLFTRLRTLNGVDVPLRVRSGTNPGGKGHAWVKSRFIPDDFLRLRAAARFARVWRLGPRVFVPARLQDNPTLDQDEYRGSLQEADPLSRAQIEDGDWSAHTDGHFKEHWFRRYTDIGDAFILHPAGTLWRKAECFILIAVDPAGGISLSADYTAMIVAAITPAGDILILDVVRERIPVEEVVPRLQRVCLEMRPLYVVMEDAFAQSAYIRAARRTPGIPTVSPMDPGGQSKLVRATPAILRAKNGQLYLPERTHWLDDFEAELTSFTGDDTLDAHDDQVDALAYLVLVLDRFGLGTAEEPEIVSRRRDPCR